MNLLSVTDLSRMGREKPLFQGVTFGLDEGDKAALIGRNGTGKSTLLSTIAGVLEPDSGSVVINREAGVSFLPQDTVFDPGDTITQHIFKSASPKLRLIREYEELCQTGVHSARFEELSGIMEQKGLWGYQTQVQSVLTELGITDMGLTMGTLSGGMLKKVALAQVLVEDTKLLLLDEPTNHLDMTTIAWLQDYLAATKRSVLMVTHDRYFLDAVCNHIYELARSRVKLYVGNYSEYLAKKQVESQIEANTERRIESVLRFERDWLLRGPCARGTKAKARIQHDMALINREKFAADTGFAFEVAGRRLGGKVLELHGVGKSYPKATAGAGGGHAPVLRGVSYTFSKGEKIGIFGDNGSGKTTLLNIMAGTVQPDQGHVVLGQNTAISYYQQNPALGDVSLTVLEYIQEAAQVMRMNDGTTLSAAQFLDRFGFEGKIQHSPVSTLSGGERKRLLLVRLLMANPNFLILDEPTNDFDIFTMNILEQFLLGFAGCLVIVSHDRYFMDKVADTLLVLDDDGGISGYVGKCSEYIQYRAMLKKERRANAEPGSLSASQTAGKAPVGQAASQRPKKLSYKEQREFEALEQEIAALEAEQKALEADMQSANYATSSAAGTRYAQIATRLEEAYARWEELGLRA